MNGTKTQNIKNIKNTILQKIFRETEKLTCEPSYIDQKFWSLNFDDLLKIKYEFLYFLNKKEICALEILDEKSLELLKTTLKRIEATALIFHENFVREKKERLNLKGYQTTVQEEESLTEPKIFEYAILKLYYHLVRHRGNRLKHAIHVQITAGISFVSIEGMKAVTFLGDEEIGEKTTLLKDLVVLRRTDIKLFRSLGSADFRL